MIKQIRDTGLTSNTMYLAAFVSVVLSIAIWVLRRGEDRPNAERFGIFVGLWAPTLMSLAKSIEDSEIADGVSSKIDMPASL